MSQCEACNKLFEVSRFEKAFLINAAPTFGGERFQIPEPRLCPACRFQRRLAFRNPIHLGKRKTCNSGKTIVTPFIGNEKFSVMTLDDWWGDSWDACEYARDFDFDAPFIDSFRPLREAVPFAGVLNSLSENSDYCSNVTRMKNCYLSFNTNNAEDCFYCDYVWDSKDCLDCTRTLNSELCYECIECLRCYSLQSSEYCEDCSNSFYLSHCKACSDCFCCANLHRKQYCVFNEQLTKAEYEAFIAKLDLTLASERRKYAAMLADAVSASAHPHMHATRVEDVSGSYIYNSRRVWNSFYMQDSED